MSKKEQTLKSIISHCKEYGFVFPSSEIYDGLSAFYDYGPNGEEWDDDDNYMYYGATFSESYFSNYSNGYAADWQATTKARENTRKKAKRLLKSL